MNNVSLTSCVHTVLLILGVVLKVSRGVIYSDHWAVHIEGGEDVARALAAKHGFEYVSRIMPEFYSFRHHHVSKRSLRDSPHQHSNLEQEDQVHWLEQQVVKTRVKRAVNTISSASFNDPKWPRMWYLNRGHDMDMNVQRAWKKGYTGQGVVVSILDDGIERDHPDLKNNYDPEASYDVNGHDTDPQPRYNYNNENRHGTRCAGEVAADANNSICSVGVAFNAGIGGVRMLDGDVTDAVEAESLSLNPNHIDVYSASWGPDDDGGTVDGPAMLARKAFYDGITEGRGGKGSIFVWASGNGGREGDNCNCDGYTNSIYTLSISSATENGYIPWYSEACSSTLASTYSSGASGEKQVVTTDLRKGCTETHTGTSASAPLAAGICALALQANPELTWRDMQHIVVQTARPESLRTDDWVVNGVGKKVSHHFGFGIMDASAMVDLARTWTTVPSQHRCEIKSRLSSKRVPVRNGVQVSLESDGCESNSRNSVFYLEHVQAIISLTASSRGGVQIYLTSPMGTNSTLLKSRRNDHSREGFTNWAFMTTHNWGETSMGRWTLEIHNGDTVYGVAHLNMWTLVQYGTRRNPIGPPPPTTAKPTQPPRKAHRTHRRNRNRNRPRPSTPDWRHASDHLIIQVPPCKRPTLTHLGYSDTKYPRNNNSGQPISQGRSSNEGPPCKKTALVADSGTTTSAELRTWSLKLYGTATPPQPGGRPPYPEWPDNPECPDGQYSLGATCYVQCPSHFYPRNQTIALRPHPANDSSVDMVTDSSIEELQQTSDEYLSTLTTPRTQPRNTEPSVIISREATSGITMVTQGTCVPCFSRVCLTCTGAHLDQCTSCVAGYQLTTLGECIAESSEEGPTDTHHRVSQKKILLVLILVALGVALCAIVIGIVCFYRSFNGGYKQPREDTSNPLLSNWSTDDDDDDDEEEEDGKEDGKEDDDKLYTSDENETVHINMNAQQVLLKTQI